MDFDRTSNCSSISNQSDDIKSTVSSLSAASVYGDEFAELRHLVDPDKYLAPARDCPTPIYNDSGCDIHYEDRIADLSLQLQSTLKLNEKYKNDLFNLERNIELRYHDKFETLLRANRQLNIELMTTKDQLERLFKRFTNTAEPSSACDKHFVQLEQKCHELNSCNTKLQGKLQEISVERSEFEVQNKQLKIDFQDCKIDNETKNACIKELKEKISNQFIEIQALLKSRNMNESALKDVQIEFEYSKKSLEWYKNQLAIMQKDKKTLLEDLAKCKSEIIRHEEKESSMNLSLKSCQNKFENLRLDTLKEKEKMYDQMKHLNLNNSYPIEEKKANVLSDSTDKALLNYYKASIQDFQKEILTIKEELHENDKTVKKLNKENSDLASHCVILQKTMQQKNIAIEEFSSNNNQLNMEMSLLKEQDYKKSQRIQQLKTNLSKLESELLTKNGEKEVIENTVHVIRQQFLSFKTQYDKLKRDLLDKNKQILNLQNENQQLFMNNNLKICELEEAREKDSYIEKLKKDISAKEQQIVDYLYQIRGFQINLKEKDQLYTILGEEKNSISKEYKAEIQRYEEVIIQYRKTVRDLENKISSLEQLKEENEHNINVMQEEIKKRNLRIEEVKVLEEQISSLERVKMENEENIKVLQEEIVEKDKKLEDIKALQHRIVSLEQLKGENEENINNLQKEIVKKDEEREKIKALENRTNNLDSLKCENGNMRIFPEETNKNTREMVELKKYVEINNSHEPTKLLSNNLEKLEGIVATELFEIKKNVQTEQKIVKNEKRNFLLKKLSKLEAHITYLNNKSEDVSKILRHFHNSRLNDSKDEEIKELKVLLQVKNLELLEKQKKYERNYRVLLRKVKEHMRGRNSAEKQNKYFQELYNNLCEENNSLKLTLSLKESEQQNEKILLNNHIVTNEKLKEKMLELESKLRKREICLRCLEYDAVNQRLEKMEEVVKTLEKEKMVLQNLVLVKENASALLQKEVQELQMKVAYSDKEKDAFACKAETIAAEKEELLKDKNTLAEKLEKLQLSYLETNKLLENKTQENLAKTSHNLLLNEQLKNLSYQMQCASQELEILNSALQNKSDELEFLEKEKSKKLMECQKQTEDYENTIDGLKEQLHESQLELNAAQSDKYFLQRLCNDIKLALKSHINYNKVLKEQLNYFCKEKQDFNSLPNILSDCSVSDKYNEAYIEQLLHQQKTPLQNKPFTDIQISLDSLRKEITVLQEQITKKNHIKA